MAGLAETEQWDEEVYQIETADPVHGGPPDLALGQGHVNAPHQQLANRTAWLRAQVVALQTAIAGIDVQPLIDAAVANLIDGAPEALDTLNELAAALNDNDSAIAALTSSLAGKLDAVEYTAADVLAKLQTVDGPTSGIYAEFLGNFHWSRHIIDTYVLSTGVGLTGGGDFTANRTISADLASPGEAQVGDSHDKLMTPLRTRQAIQTLGFGGNQTWQDVSGARAAGTAYQNTTSSPIQVSVCTVFTGNVVEVSTDGVTWITLAQTTADRSHPDTNQFMVQPNGYYRVAAGATINHWIEFRA